MTFQGSGRFGSRVGVGDPGVPQPRVIHLLNPRRRLFGCTVEDRHPDGCDGRGNCVHCDRRLTIAHDPRSCWLCTEDRVLAMSRV